MLLSKNLYKSVFSAFIGQLIYIIVGFIGNIVLTRLLSPYELGQIGLVMVFVSVSTILVESGFGGALIRKENVEEKDYSTIFIFNLVVSVLISILIISISNFVASFYGNPELSNILKALSVIPFLNAFQVTSNAKLVREMKFKKRAQYKLVALLLGTAISVFFALNGFGVWSLVLLNVSTTFILSLLMTFRERTFKKLQFDYKSFKEMYLFGINTASTNIINSIFNNVYQLILGKYFSISNVGLYYQAKRLQDVSDTLFNIILSNVFFSHLAGFQNDVANFKKEYTKIVVFVLTITSISVSLVFLYSDEIIMVFYGEKWIESSFFLKIFCLVSFFTLQELVNKNIFKVFNKTGVILRLELVKKVIQVVTILVGLYFMNIEYLLYGLLVTAILSYFLNFYVSRKIIDEITRKEILNILIVILVSTASVSLLLMLFYLFDVTGFLKLLFVPIFIIIHLLLLFSTKILDFNLIKNKI